MLNAKQSSAKMFTKSLKRFSVSVCFCHKTHCKDRNGIRKHLTINSYEDYWLICYRFFGCLKLLHTYIPLFLKSLVLSELVPLEHVLPQIWNPCHFLHTDQSVVLLAFLCKWFVFYFFTGPRTEYCCWWHHKVGDPY